jgi:peptidoglycan hydrolase-like protein with peptidoglycan-binding domain
LPYTNAVSGYRRIAAIIAAGAAVLVVAPASASAARFGSRTLTVGLQGNDVTALQGDLTAAGFPTSVTGSFNRQTIKEVRAFQRKYKLQVDGVVGPASFKELRQLLGSVNHIAEMAPGSGASGIVTTDQTDAVPSSDVLPSADSGGVGFVPTPESAAVVDASLIDGLAVPAPGTPQTIIDMIDAANRIAFLPYIYGGGHQDYVITNGHTALEAGYDCSGSVSFALHGGNLLADPLDSAQFTNYGQPGKGNWITLYTNGPNPSGIPHVYMKIAGLWFDTAAQSADNGDDRWSTTRIHEPDQSEYEPVHPAGW